MAPPRLLRSGIGIGGDERESRHRHGADLDLCHPPQTIEEYREYRQRAITFIEARNRRIAEYCRLRALEDRL